MACRRRCYWLALVFLFGAIRWGRAQYCPAILQEASTIANSLQSHYWDTDHYQTGETWTDANAYEDLNNLMLSLKSTTWGYVNEVSVLAKLGMSPPSNWDFFFRGSYDDAQWVLLLFYRIADYLTANGKDGGQFMRSAGSLYDYVSVQWDDVCGGGLWWSFAHTYKNAITNELYLLTSASGYSRTGNETYLKNAEKTAAWLLGSGMRNSDGLWNDGLDTKTCKNNGQTTWTYNQGVIASGLGLLGKILNNSTYFDEAEITLDAVTQKLTVNRILKESCDSDTPTSNPCNHDQQIFKGIFLKHLRYYLDATNDPARVQKYQSFIGAQESAIIHYGKSAANLVGSVWYAPDKGGSVFQAETSASGLAGLVAASRYAPCHTMSLSSYFFVH